MSETATTPFSKRCEILSELWFDYKTHEAFTEIIEYGDLGFPLAYAISEGIVKSTPLAENYVNDVWNLLIYTLGFEGEEDDPVAETLSDLFLQAGFDE